MTNISAVPVPQNPNAISYSNHSRLGNDVEGVTAKLACLQLARDYESNDQKVSKNRNHHNLDKNNSHRKKKSQDDDNDGDDENSNSSSSSGSSSSSSSSKEDCLVERGPLKSQFFPTIRNQPYWTSVQHIPRYVQMDDNFPIDYDSTVKEILRDKEYSEKLNPCLDQLQYLQRTNWTYCNDNDKNLENISEFPFSASIVETDSGDNLLENVMRGAFQLAQNTTEGSLFCSAIGTEISFDDDISVGEATKKLGLPDSAATTDSGHSPVGSPPVSTTPTIQYRPIQNLSYSSNSSSSCFSSSSNQSYRDASSPNNWQTSINSRFDESIACNAIDNNNSWSKMLEEVAKVGISRTEERNSSMTNTTTSTATTVTATPTATPTNSTATFLPLDEIEKSIDSTKECSNVCLNGEDIAVAIADTLPWSNLPYSVENDPTEKQIRHIQVGNIRGTDYSVNVDAAAPLLPIYRKDNETTVRQNGDKVGRSMDATDTSNDDISAWLRSFDVSLSPSEANATANFHQHDVGTKKLLANAKDDFEIPKMVASFESSSRRRRCNSDRRAVPWPSLNLPFVTASERLKERLSSEKVEKAMMSLLKRSVKELAKQDKDGDTMLMCLVGNSDELNQKMAYLVPLVERLSTLTGALTVTNDRGEDALYLAAINCPQFPYVAGYLAATMLQKEIDISQRLYHTRGETLIHAIAAQGDSHAETLAELLALRTNQGHAVFDLSKRNYDGRTALHVGVESHQPLTSGITSTDTVKWLLKYGADAKCKETKCGGTALHMAVSTSCDPALVKTLLVGRPFDLVNAINYNHDTALHVAAAMSDNVPLENQTEVCMLLIQAGARTNLANRQGKTPLALVSSERKEAIRKIFYKIS